MDNNEKHPKSFNEIVDENYSILDVSFFIFTKDRKIDNDIQNHADLLAQKSFVHAYSLRNLYNIHQSPFNIPIDILSEFVLLRAQYETFLTLGYIFIYSKNEDEKLLKFYLWQLAGLKSRLTIIQDSLFVNNKMQIIEDEKEEMQKIISKIKKICSSKNQIVSLNNKFMKCLEKDWINWRIDFLSMKTISWNKIALNIGLNKKLSNELYSYLSWYAHSEYTSIIQFKDMYKSDYKNDFLRNCFQFSNFILCSLIVDYCKIFEYAKNNFNLLPENIREYIAFNNEVFRNQRI